MYIPLLVYMQLHVYHTPCVAHSVCILLLVHLTMCISPHEYPTCCLYQNSKNFDVVLSGVSPPFSGLPSGDSEVLRCMV